MLKVAHVEKHSAGYAAGIRKGDVISAFDGTKVLDLLDCEFYDGQENFTVELLRNGETVKTTVSKQAHEPLGLTFDDDAYIKPKACANKCIFCFIDQLPKQMRTPLYFKDDDWRLSFVSGNFVTFTNVKENEIERICAKKFSPLYVSVHATDDGVRRKMLGNPNAAPILPMLKKLTQSGIELHAQIVLCPEINDGAVLQKSLEELFALYPKLNSVAVVPVGLTKHRDKLADIKPVSKSKANEVVKAVGKFSHEAQKKAGVPFAYCADELYLTAELPLPGVEFYGDLPQIENGVGLLAKFEAEFNETLLFAVKAKRSGFTAITGTAAAGFMEKLATQAKEKFPEIEFNIIPVKNEFFGEAVTVSGLVTAGDIIKQAGQQHLSKTVLLPANMLKRGEAVFLDGITLKQLSKELKRKIKVIGDGHELCRALMKVENE